MVHQILTPFDFQIDGAMWLAEGRRVKLLADDMGLGKACEAIVASDFLQAKLVRVVCPAIAVPVWQREIPKFETVKKKWEIFSYDQARIHKLHIKAQTLPRADIQIVDESHYLKNSGTHRTKVVMSDEGLIHRARKTWFMSGTPMPNHAGELWPILYVTGQTKLGYHTFINRYCVVIDREINGRYVRQRRIVGTQKSMIPELTALLQPIMLRRLQDEVLDLPPMYYTDFPIEARYELNDPELKRRMLEDLHRLTEGDPNFFNRSLTDEQILLRLQLFSGSVSALRRYVGLTKVPTICELVSKELRDRAYDKIVIFAVHSDVIAQLRGGLYKFNPEVITGKTQKSARLPTIDRFENDPNRRVLIGNVQAMGTAVTITKANQVLFAEQSWVPGENAQAAKRTRRIGQKRTTFIRVPFLINSIDERISDVLRRKAQEINSVIDKK